jgi:hypothetical protein
LGRQGLYLLNFALSKLYHFQAQLIEKAAVKLNLPHSRFA